MKLQEIKNSLNLSDKKLDCLLKKFVFYRQQNVDLFEIYIKLFDEEKYKAFFCLIGLFFLTNMGVDDGNIDE